MKTSEQIRLEIIKESLTEKVNELQKALDKMDQKPADLIIAVASLQGLLLFVNTDLPSEAE